MKRINFLIAIAFILTFFSCKKDDVNQQVIPIPNGDFELWDNMPNLYSWQTNSCPACMSQYDRYIVKKVTDVSNGQFAAKFICVNDLTSSANNRFPISTHPTILTGYIKSTIANGDTATIHIDLFSGNKIIDKGIFYETSSNATYRKIEIPISQNSLIVDSALITITGGKKQTTELYVDNLIFLKND